MLLGREGDHFAFEQAQGGHDLSAGVGRGDDGVDVAAFGGDVRVDEGVLVLLLQLQAQGVDVVAVLGGLEEAFAVDEPDGAGGAHDGDLGGGPGEVDVGAHVLGAHHVVGAAVGLAGDDGDLPDGGLTVGVEQFRAAADDAVVFLVGAGQEAGDVDEGDDGDVERVAGAHEAGGFFGGVDVEAAGEDGGLVGDDPDATAVDAAEADDDVAGAFGLDLEEFVVVEDAADDLVHVVGLVRRVRDEGVEFEVLGGQRVVDGAGDRVGGQHPGGRGLIVGRQVLDVVEGVLFAGGDVVGDAGLDHVGVRAAQIFHGDVFAGDGFDDVGAGDEHLGGLVDHDDEVGQGGGVDVAAGGGSHDQGDLGDDAGGLDVAVEDFAVQAEGDDAFLDAGAGAFVDADQGAAGLEGEVHDLDDFFAVDFAEGAAEDGGVLGEHADVAAVDGAVAGDDAVADG